MTLTVLPENQATRGFSAKVISEKEDEQQLATASEWHEGLILLLGQNNRCLQMKLVGN